MFPQQGKQCPIVIISYLGYSPPKCTCNGNQTHSSKTCKSLLKCLHDMDENVTHPLPCLEPSLAPLHMPKPRVRKHCFQNKWFLFSKTNYQVFVKSIRQPSEVNCWVILRNSHGSASEMNCWTTLQGNSSENLP